MSSRPEDGRLVVSLCTVLLDDHQELDRRLDRVRNILRVDPQHVFKYLKSSERTRHQFFDAIANAPVEIRCLVVLKSTWTADELRMTSGPERIRDAVGEAVRLLPDHIVAKQKLLVDMHRGERAIVDALRQDLRRVLRAEQRRSFAKIAPRPDHRADAAVVQVADMFAGEVRRTGTMPRICSSPRFILLPAGNEKPLT